MKISVSRLWEPEMGFRCVDREGERYLKLKLSIQDRGFLGAVTVRHKQEHYEIIDGLHRFVIARALGTIALTCSVVDLNDEAFLIAQAMLNTEADDEDYVRCMKRLLQYEPLHTADTMAALLKRTRRWVIDLLCPNHGADLEDCLHDGQIGLMNGFAIARLPEVRQSHFLQRGCNMRPTEFVPLVNEEYSKISKGWDEDADGKRMPHVEPIVVRKGWDNVQINGQTAYIRGDVAIKWSGSVWEIHDHELKLENYGSVEYLMELVEDRLK